MCQSSPNAFGYTNLMLQVPVSIKGKETFILLLIPGFCMYVLWGLLQPICRLFCTYLKAWHTTLAILLAIT